MSWMCDLIDHSRETALKWLLYFQLEDNNPLSLSAERWQASFWKAYTCNQFVIVFVSVLSTYWRHQNHSLLRNNNKQWKGKFQNSKSWLSDCVGVIITALSIYWRHPNHSLFRNNKEAVINNEKEIPVPWYADQLYVVVVCFLSFITAVSIC